MKKNLKFLVMTAVLAGFLLSALSTNAYPPYVRKSEKFGAKDCLFCHKEPNGGEGWNERGNWLIAEKDKRKADSIDVEWLADYKPAVEGEKKEGEGEKKEGEKKEGEKKEGEKKPEKPAEISSNAAPAPVASSTVAAPEAKAAVTAPETTPKVKGKAAKAKTKTARKK